MYSLPTLNMCGYVWVYLLAHGLLAGKPPSPHTKEREGKAYLDGVVLGAAAAVSGRSSAAGGAATPGISPDSTDSTLQARWLMPLRAFSFSLFLCFLCLVLSL